MMLVRGAGVGCSAAVASELSAEFVGASDWLPVAAAVVAPLAQLTDLGQGRLAGALHLLLLLGAGTQPWSDADNAR
jgi:hypothetical protein